MSHLITSIEAVRGKTPQDTDFLGAATIADHAGRALAGLRDSIAGLAASSDTRRDRDAAEIARLRAQVNRLRQDCLVRAARVQPTGIDDFITTWLRGAHCEVTVRVCYRYDRGGSRPDEPGEVEMTGVWCVGLGRDKQVRLREITDRLSEGQREDLRMLCVADVP